MSCIFIYLLYTQYYNYLNLSITLFLGFRSWQLYLFICAMPSLISAVTFSFMPESPKYLLSIGKPKEALEVIKKIFSMNTGKPKRLFPVSSIMVNHFIYGDIYRLSHAFYYSTHFIRTRIFHYSSLFLKVDNGDKNISQFNQTLTKRHKTKFIYINVLNT